MSHFLTIPINEHGVLLNQRFEERLQSANADPFGLTDIFLYSQDWCCPGSDAQAEQNAFSLGLAKALQGLICASPAQWPKIGAAFAPLELPVLWPSRLSEEQDSLANFTALGQRADSIGRRAGYSLLRLMSERQKDRQPYCFNLVGHSVGCRVLCSALQALAQDEGMLTRLAANEFNVALLQPAADSDSLAPERLYGQLQKSIPKLRMLITTSSRHTALIDGYPQIQRVIRRKSGTVEAMGATVPTGDRVIPVDQRFDVTNSLVPTFTARLGVANLTPLHDSTANDCEHADGSGGLHSNINVPQIHELLARFFAQ